MSRYFNEAGEPLLTAAQARFEDYLDADSDAGDPDDRWDYYEQEPADDDDDDD